MDKLFTPEAPISNRPSERNRSMQNRKKRNLYDEMEKISTITPKDSAITNECKLIFYKITLSLKPHFGLKLRI